MSRTELAAKINTGRAYVSLLFRADRHFGERTARHIESALNMSDGYLDSSGQPGEGTQSWSKPQDLVEDIWGLVSRVDLVVANGEVSYEERQLPAIAMTKASMLAKGITSSEGLVCWTVEDAGCEPTIQKDDLVLLDTNQTTPVDGLLYAVVFASQLRIKRLSRSFDGGIVASSDDPRFPKETIGPDQLASLKIIGRVVYRSGVV